MKNKELIERITPLFIEHGFKSFRVDDIANSLNISKRTLYEFYGSKKEIINDSFSYVLSNFSEIYTNNYQNSENAVDAFYGLWFSINDFFPLDKQQKNIKEMEKYYRKLYEARMIDAHKLAKFLFENFCEIGEKQGFVRSDFNKDVQSNFFADNYISLISNYYFVENENYGKSIMDNIIIYIRGVLTEKGFKELEKVQQQYL